MRTPARGAGGDRVDGHDERGPRWQGAAEGLQPVDPRAGHGGHEEHGVVQLVAVQRAQAVQPVAAALPDVGRVDDGLHRVVGGVQQVVGAVGAKHEVVAQLAALDEKFGVRLGEGV